MAHVVTVYFKIKPEFIDHFLVAMKQQAQDSLELEPNCTYFDVCINPDDFAEIFLYEIYQTEADFQFHLESAHFKNFSAKVGPWVDAKKSFVIRDSESAYIHY